MSALENKAVALLNKTRATPSMYAISEEAMLMRISTLLEVAEIKGFKPSEFYIKHGGKDGSGYLLKRPDGMDFDTWAHIAIDDALSMIGDSY